MNGFVLVVGAVLATAGVWGWRNFARLISPELSEESRAHQAGVLQRGAAMLLVAGAGFLLFELYRLFLR